MKLKLIKRSCPNCESNNFRIFLKSKDNRFSKFDNLYTIVKCNVCNLQYLNPVFVETDLNKMYGLSFYSGNGIFLDKITKFIAWISGLSFIKMIKKYKSFGKTLDVGCGLGNLVLLFSKNGFDSYGLEINNDSKLFVDSQLKRKIVYSTLEKANFKKNSFDLITATHVLEHVYDLKTFLKEIKKILKKDGFFYIKVPNSDFFEYKLFRNYAYNLEVPRHLSFFTKKTLENILKNAGYDEVFFIRSNFFDLLNTPASFYYSVKYYLNQRKVFLPIILDRLLFIIMIIIRFMFRIFFIFQQQDIQVIACSKK